MARIGYHASHEQFSPAELLRYVHKAEQAGFETVTSSDHITPWSVRQGNSGFTWAWLGAALQMTKDIDFGVLAIPGGWRYHPVIVAHAFATLAQIFPNRFRWIAVGSGEAMNECVVGQGWPEKPERHARLREGVEIIKSLWRGETVTRQDGHHRVEHAKLWSLPKISPKIYGAALSPETAGWMGEWADGLITVRSTMEKLSMIIDNFRQKGGNGKPLVLQCQISWDETEAKARANAYDQWRHAAADIERDNLKTPEEFDFACRNICPEDMDKAMLITSKAEDIIEELKRFSSLGFDEIHIHNAGRNQDAFIDFFKTSIFPVLRTSK